ncbi:MAG: hypothetical protein VB056_00380 [Sphaerochaeta associata]|uniref:hypothetical protein n=1 Tax=Sphaerochaeta associata TaxID=1129264 RepID=UPI002B1F52AC|nr:hypothetical protein [Sphaerochaeta associata]MEA5027308.1 hypothetical protein [Sphaerochaeta associata]
MKHSRTIISVVVLVALVLLGGCATKMEVINPHQGDITYLYKNLPKLHVDFFHETSRTDFKNAYVDAVRRTENASDIDLYFSLRELASYANDSHTSIGLTQELVAQLSAIPVQFSYVEGAWRVSVVERMHESLLGGEVIAINGFPMSEVERLASPLFSHDNQVWLRHYLSQQLNLTNLYTYLGISTSPTEVVTLTVKPRSIDENQTISLHPVSAEEYGMLSFATWYQTHPETGATNAPYRALLFEEKNTLFVQYNVCTSYEEYPLDGFIKEILALVESASFDHVIIDLRYNSGGDSRLLEPLVDGLDVLQEKQGFSIDVLIGEGTFSSALMNAMHFKKRTNARLVGEPTGGSLNHYGEIKQFSLPGSGIPVTYSTKHFVMDKTYQAGSLIPDLAIEKTVDDILSGRDTVVEALLQSY